MVKNSATPCWPLLLLVLFTVPLRPGPIHAQTDLLTDLQTRAEGTGFRETTPYDEVVRFSREVSLAHPMVHLTTFGYTTEGRPLPLLVVGEVEDASPEAVRASGKTRVYVQGGIHAGEISGKEALLILLREFSQGDHALWTDSLVLLVAPLFNADGNENVDL